MTLFSLSLSSFAFLCVFSELGVAAPHTIRSGAAELSLSQEGGVSIFYPDESGADKFISRAPIDVRLFRGDDEATTLTAVYQSVKLEDGALECSAEITSGEGSVFLIEDRYSPGSAPDTFAISREVRVVSAGQDEGFQSRISFQGSDDFLENEYFIPGIWYQNNSKAHPNALAANQEDSHYLIREDRMPLPVAMMRQKRSGHAFSLIRIAPNGATSGADYAGARVVDEKMRVSSLGFQGREKTQVTFCHPASEGERSYFRSQRLAGNGKGWVERYHPVKRGISHRYEILIHLQRSRSFPDAMRNSWRMAFQHASSPVKTVNIPEVYQASMDLVSHWVKKENDAAGLPFRLSLPEGRLEHAREYNYQMGFVGQQIPLAYHLLRYGLENRDAEMVSKGEAMMDFWSRESLTEEGLPKIWYDTHPHPHWRNAETTLRSATDGVAGALMAWNVMKKHGKNRPDWLRYCRRFGDWLVEHQNADGSWHRAYKWDGSIAHEGKSNTSNAIRLLVDLHLVTGEQKYRKAALAAGDYCWNHGHLGFDYVGGTPDNPNVLDKEAGFLMLEAFLALWDMTGEQKFLEAAARAADFTETWAYCWDVPIPAGDNELVFPATLPTTGYSIIATGHSGADLFLAGAPYFYYRLYLATGDPHYGRMARLFLHTPRKHVDVGGSLGYGRPGLCAEAINLSIDSGGRGRGVDVWLPWLSYSMVEPVVRLQETYGLIDCPELNGAGFANMRKKDRGFAKTRGMLKAVAR